MPPSPPRDGDALSLRGRRQLTLDALWYPDQARREIRARIEEFGMAYFIFAGDRTSRSFRLRRDAGLPLLKASVTI
jgi:hypothetical protein